MPWTPWHGVKCTTDWLKNRFFCCLLIDIWKWIEEFNCLNEHVCTSQYPTWMTYLTRDDSSHSKFCYQLYQNRLTLSNSLSKGFDWTTLKWIWQSDKTVHSKDNIDFPSWCIILFQFNESWRLSSLFFLFFQRIRIQWVILERTLDSSVSINDLLMYFWPFGPYLEKT